MRVDVCTKTSHKSDQHLKCMYYVHMHDVGRVAGGADFPGVSLNSGVNYVIVFGSQRSYAANERCERKLWFSRASVTEPSNDWLWFKFSSLFSNDYFHNECWNESRMFVSCVVYMVAQTYSPREVWMVHFPFFLLELNQVTLIWSWICIYKRILVLRSVKTC